MRPACDVRRDGVRGDGLRRCVAVLALALTPCAGLHAQAPTAVDPMASVECKNAREALEAAYRAATDRREETALKLQAARRNTAAACLGRGGAAAPREAARDEPRTGTPRNGMARETPNRVPPAQEVPRVAPNRPQPLPGTPRATPATPPPGPVVIPRPTLITSCDDAGCWGNDGRRYNRAGSQLVGPRGTCALQGNVLNCP
jgi:hypothetical protein